MSFQTYQLQLCACLRDVQLAPPLGCDLQRLVIYQTSVFNNLSENLAACFKLSKRLLGKQAWSILVRDFLREHSSNTPIFREIPKEFLTFLTRKNTLPAHLFQLCHYEWIQLMVATHSASGQMKVVYSGDLMQSVIVCNPTLMLLAYDYPVHLFSARYKSKQAVPTYLAVYRRPSFEVGFAELNELTFLLLQKLQGNETGEAALRAIAVKAFPINETQILKFGRQILESLCAEGLIGVSEEPLQDSETFAKLGKRDEVQGVCNTGGETYQSDRRASE